MAINPNSEYPANTNPPDASYPYGSAKNVTTSGDGTGTPWEKEIINDNLGFQQALLEEAGILPSGTAETAISSQYLESLRKILVPYKETTASLINSANSSIPVGTVIKTGGYTTLGDGGGAYWRKTALGGQPVAQSPVQLGDALLNDTSGNQWEMIGDARFSVGTFSELEALNIANVGQVLVCKERFNSEYIVQNSSYVALAGDATLASGLVAQLQQSDNGWHIEQFGAKELTESTQAIKDARDRAGTSVIFGDPVSYLVSSEIVFSEDKCGISSTSGTMVLFNTSLTEKTLTFSPANPELGNQINSIVLNGVRLGRSAGSTNAVALSLYAVNSPRITNFISDGSHTAVDIKGVSDANFSNWSLFAGAVSGYSAGSALIEYDGYPLSGGGFTKAFTTNIVNSIASTDFKCDHVLNVHMCDGLEISNSYWGSPFTSHVNLKPTNNNEGITKLLVDNIYFDGISPSTGSIGAVTIPTVTATGTFLVESKFNNCSLSNFTGDAVSIQGEANSLEFNNTTISNVDGWAINSTATNGSLKVLGGEIINVDIGTGTGGITVGAIDSVNITGVEFKTIAGTAVSLSSTTNGIVCASTFEAVGTEISESGVTNYKSVGNVSDGSAMKDIVDIGGGATFTPTISFGGASVGVTYSTQEASYQQIGDYVHFNITIVLTNKGSSTGDLVIGGGLPVCDQDSALNLDIRNVTAGSGDAYMSAFIVSAGTGIQINRLLPSGARQVLNDTDITNTTQLRISGVYKA